MIINFKGSWIRFKCDLCGCDIAIDKTLVDHTDGGYLVKCTGTGCSAVYKLEAKIDYKISRRPNK